MSTASCRSSPDGAWRLIYRNESLVLTRTGSGKWVRMYHSTDACCSYITWVKPHMLLFDDDYRVMTLNPATRRVAVIAGFSDFLVSPDGQWMAGYAGAPPEESETVGVVSLRKPLCLEVPHGSHQTDEIAGFTRSSKGVIVVRRGFIPNSNATGPNQLVQFTLTSLHTACPHWMLAR